MIKVSSRPKHVFRLVHINAKLKVINFISITLVHVFLEKQSDNFLRCEDSEHVKDSDELGLGHMAAPSNVEVLEKGFQVESLYKDLLFVCLADIHHQLLFSFIKFEILLSSEICV